MTTLDAVEHEPGAVAAELAAALTAALRQIHDLVAGLTDEQYTRKPGGALPSGIGGHVRHNLDHVANLLAGLPGGSVDYDRRDRGTPVECDRRAALAAVRALEEELAEFPWGAVPRVVRLTLLAAPDRPPVEVLTTAERELAFVLSHTIHHNALIAVLAAAVGGRTPQGFGYAPATLAYLKGARPCVR